MFKFTETTELTISSQHDLILDNIRYRAHLVPSESGYHVFVQIKDYRGLLTCYSQAFKCKVKYFKASLLNYHQNKPRG